MSERIYKVGSRNIVLTVTYFAKDSISSIHEPSSEILNKIRGIHRHSEHEVFFVPNGEIKVVFEDGYTSFSNSAVIVPAGVGHYTVLNSDSFFVAYLEIERDEGGILSDQIAEGIASYALDDGDAFYLSELREAEQAYPEDCQHLIHLLFSKLIRKVAPSDFSPATEDKTSSKYAFVLDSYIDKHYCERITLADIAAELYLCERQVSRIIRREYKCSFADFVNMKRLSVAAMMLRYTQMNISDIARSVGYENHNYFYRVFKKRYNVSPAVYRENSKSDDK